VPQLRKDPILARRVIIATQRAKRPSHFGSRGNADPATSCPFCENNEDMTPPEILAYRPSGSSAQQAGWTLRVVPNKFPAVTREEDFAPYTEGMYQYASSVGAHEVIIETPRHETNMAALGEGEVAGVLSAYRERVLALKEDRRFRSVLIFKNHGPEAGATIEHTHSQLIALPIVPVNVSEELKGARHHYETYERCVYCDLVRHEASTKTRLVSEHDAFVVLCPFAPRFPFETWILPKKHSAYFEHISQREIVDLAATLRETLGLLNRTLREPPLNYVIHSMPLHEAQTAHYHWHIEIMPKLTQIAGFELGTGFYINPLPPERATALLRAHMI
jgi:UDPglucose--hexose-1-phosphate uridylyltransferase